MKVTLSAPAAAPSAAAPATASRAPRRVEVRVGVDRATAPRPGPVPLVVAGIVPLDSPWHGERWPQARLGSTRRSGHEEAVEHLVFRGREDLRALPGLARQWPSRLRDAVSLALRGAVPEVHLVLARGPALVAPWMLHHPDFLALCDTFVDELRATQLVLPDAGGPLPGFAHGEQRPGTRVALLRRVVQAWRSRLAERQQLLFLDLPEGAGLASAPELSRLAGADVVLCRWQGPAGPLAAQGWRSAAAAVAAHYGALDVIESAEGATLPLGPGRARSPSRDLALGFRRPPATSEAVARLCLGLELEPGGTRASVRGEPALRRPLGSWSVPALRTVKAVHHVILRTAEAFVFERLAEDRAFAFGLAMTDALEPFIQAGLLTGASPHEGPLVAPELVRDPAAPGLAVTVAGQLRPWLHRVRVRVRLRDGARPLLETAAQELGP